MDHERRLWLHGLRVGDCVAVHPAPWVYPVVRLTRRRIYVGSLPDGYDRDTGEGVTPWAKGTSLAPVPVRREG